MRQVSHKNLMAPIDSLILQLAFELFSPSKRKLISDKKTPLCFRDLLLQIRGFQMALKLYICLI